MLDFEQIRSQYPEQIQQFEKGILREYLQYNILQGIFESNFANKVSFLGGTALRIIYGNNRFSEDIDLDNFGLSWEEFEDLIAIIQKFLTLEGFLIEIKKVEKAAYHCHIKFPKILYENGISPLPQEKILIKVDTFAQGYAYEPSITILNKFDIFSEVRVTPLPVLLSQKLYAAVHRPQPKGRDFYDITFLLGQTKPDYGYLTQKLGISSPIALKDMVQEKIDNYDFEALAEDVRPFLIRQTDINRVLRFATYWNQVELD
jgi:predicted nucleotidyltransferase component of viral defense system